MSDSEDTEVRIEFWSKGKMRLGMYYEGNKKEFEKLVKIATDDYYNRIEKENKEKVNHER